MNAAVHCLVSPVVRLRAPSFHVVLARPQWSHLAALLATARWHQKEKNKRKKKPHQNLKAKSSRGTFLSADRCAECPLTPLTPPNTKICPHGVFCFAVLRARVGRNNIFCISRDGVLTNQQLPTLYSSGVAKGACKKRSRKAPWKCVSGIL